MSEIINEVRKGFYLDSVALMRLSAEITAIAGIEEAVLMIGTPSNLKIMNDAGVLNATGEAAGPNDLIIALRADNKANANKAIAHAHTALEGGSSTDNQKSEIRARTLAGGLSQYPNSNLVLISTPGSYAAKEARTAIAAGLNVMIFSDNLSLTDETKLKQLARANDLLVMGPDCGTAYLNGVPLAFANSLSHNNAKPTTAAIAASGTGLQEFAVLLSRLGGNLKHGIGVGGRDLSDAVGAISTLTAIDLLAADDSVEQIVLISKPPGADTAKVVFDKLANCGKKSIACVFGYEQSNVPASTTFAATLRDAAEIATGNTLEIEPIEPGITTIDSGRQLICGLYSGGTLCTESQLVLQRAGIHTTSNAQAGSSTTLDETQHHLIDLGSDEYTVGRPHPMMEPLVREDHLQQALQNPLIAVILMDVVLGYGAHEDPSAVIVASLEEHNGRKPLVIVSVCGTESDPQGFQKQCDALTAAGVLVCNCNCSAAELTAKLITQIS